MSDVALTCPTCGESCDDLRFFRWCMYCWYVFCGGDQASDEDLAMPPSVWLNHAPPALPEQEKQA